MKWRAESIGEMVKRHEYPKPKWRKSVDEQKVTVIAKEGVARVGNDFFTLEDHSREKIECDSMPSFLALIGTGAGYQVYWRRVGSGVRVEAWPESPDRYSIPVEMDLRLHPVLADFLTMREDVMSHNDFFRFIQCFKRRTTSSLYQTLRGYKFEKITSVQVQRDNQGNYAYCISRQTPTEKKSDMVEWPETVYFNLPLFEHGHAIGFQYDFEFDYQETKDGVAIQFSLRNPEEGIEINNAIEKALVEDFNGLECPVINGAFEVIPRDDSWKYQENKL